MADHKSLVRFLVAGASTVGLYVGGVWFGTDVMNWPARPVNAFFYVLATAISFVLAYTWIFPSDAKAGGALLRYILLQVFGVGLNFLWVEGGLRFTPVFPWVIAATYFIIWPFISYTTQRHYVFK